ncbi:RNA repair domain-containing protein [Kutzneria buriramensis]|uniref:Endonuclease/exonuclease/phosphatase family protein n=1 Tax=Kutzneria buriramensis TaxID=1045776 RepID=A0A3E0HGP8_9PSEU|nr:RNA repair domain-containing protein [Kutzneria buriramensis]REH44928.1 endonuclease/exonuclease/phosphatase family protein [Kutzneria buriramensis]
MRTSEEIYHRVRWDPRFDPARFVLGIGMRGRPPKRLPLASYEPGGEIPWHRIVFVEADGELVWDRATGVDRIDESDAGRVLDPRRLRAPFFTAKAPYAWDGLAWSPVSSVQDGRYGDSRLRVLTWNTLWDRYDSDRIDTSGRRPRLLDELERADADVIALQEVEAALLTLLLAAPWVRGGYTVSEVVGREVDATGLLLLSRVPVREAGGHVLSPHKGVVAFVVETAGGPVAVATTHLTSDHHEQGAERRVAELAAVDEGLSDVDCPVVLLGDFNDGTETPADVLRLADAWTEAHGSADQTPTFDPLSNPLAAVSSLTGRAARLDRVLVRGLRVAHASLRDEPVSDHYGVEAELLVGKEDGTLLDVPATARTAVAWLPPVDVAAVEALRRRHDPQADRWPPHVNVLFGFVPESEFDRAVPLLAAAAAEVPPFAVRLDGVHTFGHRDDATIWLDPVALEWTALRDAVARPFPGCRERAEGFTPHLTLGRGKDAQTVAAECAARLSPMDTAVGELVVLSRRGDEPMRVRARVALGSGAVEWVPDDSQVTTGPSVPVDSIVDRVGTALPLGVVHLVGSHRMGNALADADVDLVAAVPGRVEVDVPGATDVRPVTGARVPGVRMRLDGRSVDLVLVETGAIDPAEAVLRRAELGSAASIALSAVTDANAISGRNATLSRLVKAWAKARGLDSAPFGGLPSIAWAVLAACVGSAEPVDFFAHWAAWDWRNAVALRGDHASYGPVTVMTPSEPIRSCTEQVGPGMLDLLTHELYRAWEIASTSSDPWPHLLATPPMHRRHAAWAVVTASDEGRLRGRMRALLTLLEEADMPDVHGWPRPFAPGRYAIGLGRTPVNADRLAGIAAGWHAGATVEWLPNGGVPTLR